MTVRRTVHALTTIVLVLGLGVLVPAPAHAGWQSNVAYYRQGSVCRSQDTNVVIGASVYQQELGKEGVTRMRVKFLLYDTDPKSAGIHVAKLSNTKKSGTFPNDKKSYWWNGGKGATQTWTVAAGSGEWWMVAKLTWERPGKRDWNYKLPVAYCAWSPATTAGSGFGSQL